MNKKDALDKAKGILHARMLAYTQVFGSEQGKVVLTDLDEFCFKNRSTFHQDARLHAVAEGRRETRLRIQHFTEFSLDEICELYLRKDLIL